MTKQDLQKLCFVFGYTALISIVWWIFTVRLLSQQWEIINQVNKIASTMPESCSNVSIWQIDDLVSNKLQEQKNSIETIVENELYQSEYNIATSVWEMKAARVYCSKKFSPTKQFSLFNSCVKTLY